MTWRIRRWATALVTTGIALWVALAVGLDRYGQREAVGAYDAIVVAGCRVLPDGHPSPALQNRTRKAVELWRAGIAPTIVFTGGVGRYPPSEARAASTFAQSLGVPANAMVVEDRSTSTLENAQYAAQMLGPASRVLVVTDSYHVFRAQRVFGQAFATTDGTGSLAPIDARTKGAMREVLAIAYYTARGRI